MRSMRIDRLQRAVILVFFTVLSLYTATAPLRGTRFEVIPHILTVLLLLSAIPIAVVKSRYEIAIHTFLALSAFTCFFLTTTLLNPFYTTSNWGELYIFYVLGMPLMLFVLPVLLLRDRRGLKWLMNVHLLTAVCIGVLILLVGFGFFSPQYRLVAGTRVSQLQGLFAINTYPLHSTPLFGIYVLPAITLVWAHVDDADSSLWAAILLLVSVFLLVIVFLVQSRKVWLAVLVSGFVYGYLHPRFRSLTVSAGILSIPIGLLGLSIVYVTGFGIGSLQTRLNQFSVAIPFIFENPLGRGHSAFSHLTRFDVAPHNFLLAAGAGFGILALVFLLLASGLVVLQLFRSGYHSSDPLVRAGAAAAIGMFVVLTFTSDYEMQRLWLMAGVFLAYTDVVLSERSSAASE